MTLSLVSTDLSPISIDRTIVDGAPAGSLFASAASPLFTQLVLPTHSFADAPEFDVIFVPGGYGTRDLERTAPHVAWLEKRILGGGVNNSSYHGIGSQPPSPLAYTMSICTGASLLARANVLRGRNATTNKAAFNWVRSVPRAESVNWVPEARWVVDGNVWTSAGVSAGTDMTLAWVEALYGRNESERVRNVMEWNAVNRTDDPFAAYFGLV